ncbi:hypothetical protein [Candidatus Methylocalor cossyra]|uniref:PBP domain-containing protein n=1 Tax=Candidatus Methylocalor cossyra TaxID=3108543 RepID=A0ABP1CB49_9GAMM
MKLNRIFAAIAALHCGSALALPPTETPDIEIYMAGSTGQDFNLELLFDDLCVAGTLDTYYDGPTGSAGTQHRAYFCNLDTSKVSGLSTTTPKVLLHKTSVSGGKGGSGLGVNPVMLKQPLDAMSIKNNNCQQPVNGEKFWRCRITNPGDIIQQVPDAGISDVNPEMFTGPNTPQGVAPVDAAKVAKLLEVHSGGALVFNTPVTLKLRNALQAAQLFSGDLPADCTVGNETARCMPSLNRELLASIFTGQIGSWDKVKAVKADGSSKALTDFGAQGEITDTKIYICRRTNGSGTQAITNAKILNAPCTPGAVNPLETSNDLTGPVVKLNAGAGDVDKCLTDFDSGANASKQNPNGVKAWAIGIQSTEKNKNETLAYRFIKIDGVAPTLEEAAAGRYYDVGELTYQWLKVGGPTGDKLKILQRIATDAGKPSVLAVNNKDFVHLFGQGGYLAASTSGFSASDTGAFDPNNPVTPYSHAPNGLSLDNCRVPLFDSNAKASRL